MPPEQLSFDLREGRERRNQGVALVSGKNAEWMSQGLTLIAALRPGMQITGEQIRAQMLARGLRPRNVHAWGALTRTAAVRGLLRDTGRTAPMQATKSHARRTPVWERC